MPKKKAVHFNTGKKEISILVDESEIIKQENGSVEFILQGEKLNEFLRANDIINEAASIENIPVREIKQQSQDIDLPFGAIMSDSAANTFSSGWYDKIDINNTEYTYLFDEKYEIFVAMELFKRDSLTRRIIELMVQFSLGRILLEGSTKAIRNWYYEWMRQIKITKFLRQFFLEYYRSANITVVKQMLPYKSQSKFDSVKFNAAAIEENDKIEKCIEKDKISYEQAAIQINSNKKIPYKYAILDPRLVDIDIADGLEFGRVRYSPSPDIIEKYNSKMSKSNPNKGIDSDFLKSIKDSKSSGIILKPSFASQFFRMKQSYEKYASPLCIPAVPHIQMKNKMRDMDLSIIDSVKNKILKVTIGDKDFPAKPNAMRTMDETLRKKGKVFTILWNHTLNMEWIEPKYTELNHEKYKNVDKDIREAYGITPVLLGDTEGQNYATAYVSMKGFIENLQDGVDTAIEFLTDEFLQIASVMGFKECPRPKIETINLTDTINMIKLQQAANQNGILSKQTVCEAMGYDFETEKQRMKEEKALMDDGVIVVGSPNTKSKNEETKTVEEKVETLNKNQTGKPVLKQGLTDEDTRGIKKTNKSVSSIEKDEGSLIEIFKIRHVGKRLYTKLYQRLLDLGKVEPKDAVLRLMTAIPRSAFTYLEDDMSNLDKEKIEEINSFVDEAKVKLFNDILDNLKENIGMKHISKLKFVDIVGEAWAIYKTKI